MTGRGFGRVSAMLPPEAGGVEHHALAEQVAMLKKQIVALEAQIAAANNRNAQNRSLDGN